MASVTIDIPGIGPIEANNAATESTLRELVDAIKGIKPAGSGQIVGGKGGGKGSGGQGGGGGGQGAAGAARAAQNSAGASNAAGKAATSMAGKLGATAKVLTSFAGSAFGAVKAFAEFSGAIANQIDALADLGDSITGAANQIPLFGSFFAPIAGAVEKSVNAFQQASQAGATFGGNVTEMNRAASAAGMTLDKFASLVASNGEAMRLLGGTTEEGARRFAELGKTMRRGGAMQGLNNLGFSTQQINEGMASYVEILGRTGQIEGKSNAQLAAGSAKYLKELDLITKVTGQSRKEAEEAQKKLLGDAQYQAKVTGMSTEAADAFRNTITGLPPGLQGLAKDIITTGTATTDEAQQFSAMMPKSAELMRKFAEVTDKGGVITQEMRNELNNTLREEGKLAKEQYKEIGKFSKDLGPAFNGIVTASNISADALKKGAKDQANTNKTTDNMAASAERARRVIAEVSNAFTSVLAGSGLLDSLMDAFGLVADFVKAFVVPIFKVLGAIIKPVVSVIKAILQPALSFLGITLNAMGDLISASSDFFMFLLTPLTALSDLLKNAVVGSFKALVDLFYSGLMPAFYAVTDFLEDNLGPVFRMFGRILDDVSKFIKDVFQTSFEGVSNFIKDVFVKPFKDVSAWFAGVFKPILDTLAPVLSSVSQVFSEIKNRVTKFLDGFNTLSDVTEYLGQQFDKMSLAFEEFVLWLDKKTDLVTTDEEKKAFEEREKVLAEKGQAIKNREAASQARRDKQAQDNAEAASAEQKKRDDERKKRDANLAKSGENVKKQIDSLGRSTGEASEATKEATAAAKEKLEIDYSSPEAVAKSFFAQQKSPLVKQPEPLGTGIKVSPDMAKTLPGKLGDYDALQKQLNSQGIKDPKAIANIMAQVQAESGGVAKSENLNYSGEKLFELYGAGNKMGNKARFKTMEEANAVAAKGPEAVGNVIYGDRMGNAGDEGFKYRGRGLIQLTGKDNYAKFGKMIGVDLVKNPDLANDPNIAQQIAAAYFAEKQKKGVDLTNIEAVGKSVGYAGGKAETAKRAQLAAGFEAKLGGTGTSGASAPTQVASATEKPKEQPKDQKVMMASAATPKSKRKPMWEWTKEDYDKKALEEQAKEELAKKEEASVKSGSPGMVGEAPQDPIQVALASLNTTMGDLLREQRMMNRTLVQQLSATQGLSGDLFTAV